MKKKAKILIVDDDQLMIQTIAQIISDANQDDISYDIVTASNGLEALKVMHNNKRWGGLAKNLIDCIVCDIKMPKMNGFEFLEAWQKTEFFYSVPVILLSAYEDIQKWEKATDVSRTGVVKYLKKPLDNNDELLDILHRIIVKQDIDLMIEETLEQSYERRKVLKNEQ
jgi:CheY-like chemotaxis protein